MELNVNTIVTPALNYKTYWPRSAAIKDNVALQVINYVGYKSSASRKQSNLSAEFDVLMGNSSFKFHFSRMRYVEKKACKLSACNGCVKALGTCKIKRICKLDVSADYTHCSWMI